MREFFAIRVDGRRALSPKGIFWGILFTLFCVSQSDTVIADGDQSLFV